MSRLGTDDGKLKWALIVDGLEIVIWLHFCIGTGKPAGEPSAMVGRHYWYVHR